MGHVEGKEGLKVGHVRGNEVKRCVVLEGRGQKLVMLEGRRILSFNFPKI